MCINVSESWEILCGTGREANSPLVTEPERKATFLEMDMIWFLVYCEYIVHSFKVLHSGCALLLSRGREVNQMYICQRVHLNTKSFFSCKTEKQIQVIPDKNHHFHFIIISSILISQFISAFSVRIYCYVVKVHPLSIINNWRAGGDPSWGGGVQPGQVTSS